MDVTGTGEDDDSVELLDDAELFICAGLSLSSETVSVQYCKIFVVTFEYFQWTIVRRL